MSSQYGELRPTNGWDLLGSLGHPNKFQRVSRLGFVTAPTSLNGGQPNFARCLAVYWADTLCMHLGRLLPPNGILSGATFTASKSCVVRYWLRCCPALEQWASTKVCGVGQGMELRNFCRECHLYSAERPSRWASPHILVVFYGKLTYTICDKNEKKYGQNCGSTCRAFQLALRDKAK